MTTTAPHTSPTAVTSFGLVTDILRLRRMLGEHRGLFAGSLALIVGLQLCTAAASALTAWTTARVAADILEGLWLWLALLATAVVLVGLLTWFESWWSHVLAYRVLSTMRLSMHASIARIAPGGLAGRRAGEVAGAAVNDVEQLEWFYAHTAGATLAALLSPCVVVATSVAVVGPVGLLPAAGLAALLSPLWFLGPVQARQGERVRSELSALKADTLEGAQGLRDLVTLDATRARTELVLRRTEQVQRARMTYNVRSGAESAIADSVMAAATLATLALLGARVRDGVLDPVIVPLVVVLVFHTFAPVAGVYAMWQRLGELAAAARRVENVSHAPSVVVDDDASPVPFSAVGDVELIGVHAGYGERDVLRGVDLRIPAGQVVALVGASGAGKSTLAHLLVRFADPTSGCVRVAGRDLRTVAADRVRERLVLVPQTSYAMRASLRDNLLLARPDATQDDLLRSVHAAALGDLVDTLDGGLDAPLGEGGGTLSGGQLQRLAIARGLLLDPDVLVLDEPTAHLDALAEAELMRSLRRARPQRTTVLIAHRVSTIRAADRVVVLEDGQVVSDGTHDALLVTSPPYRRLVSDETTGPVGPEASTH